MFRLLMRDQYLQVIKVTLAVVTPGPREQFLRLGVLPLLLFRHAWKRCWMSEGKKGKGEKDGRKGNEEGVLA
jgi:hypothetical protein